MSSFSFLFFAFEMFCLAVVMIVVNVYYPKTWGVGFVPGIDVNGYIPNKHIEDC